MLTPVLASDNATVSRLESFGFERREVEIATAFGEISGQSDGPKMYDWVSTVLAATLKIPMADSI
jgi:hypothetical protein